VLRYAIRSILVTIPLLLILATVVFFAMRAVPGGPAYAILGEQASAEAIAALEQRLGLDRPLLEQYWKYISGLLTGDLGTSLFNRLPVGRQLLQSLPYTAELAGASMAIALLLGIPAGIWMATRRNTVGDYVARVLSLVGLTIPEFYLGVLLIMVFSLQLDWFPMLGAGDLASTASTLHHLFLPSLALGLTLTSFIARATRANLLEVLSEDYLNTARAKGLPERRVLLKHALRNSLTATVTVVGMYTALLLGGAVMVETVFTRPGIGKLLVEAVYQRDYPMIQGGLLLFAACVASANMLVDISYGFLDPRIRYD